MAKNYRQKNRDDFAQGRLCWVAIICFRWDWALDTTNCWKTNLTLQNVSIKTCQDACTQKEYMFLRFRFNFVLWRVWFVRLLLGHINHWKQQTPETNAWACWRLFHEENTFFDCRCETWWLLETCHHLNGWNFVADGYDEDTPNQIVSCPRTCILLVFLCAQPWAQRRDHENVLGPAWNRRKQ